MSLLNRAVCGVLGVAAWVMDRPLLPPTRSSSDDDEPPSPSPVIQMPPPPTPTRAPAEPTSRDLRRLAAAEAKRMRRGARNLALARRFPRLALHPRRAQVQIPDSRQLIGDSR